MSLAELEHQVLSLSAEERREFARWYYQNEANIFSAPLDENDETEQGEISEAMKTELLLRKQEYVDHPERFREVKNKAELKAYFDGIWNEIPAGVSSAR